MITPDDIREAHARIRAQVRHTPILRPGPGSFGLPFDLCLKLELLQHTGSFKPRGAFNNLLSRPVPSAGVAAASGGNHGAAVAYAASVLGHRAKIFVPEVSSPAKIARIRDAGADLVVSGARYDDALALCNAYVAETGALSIHAFDSDETHAGQGTVGLEWEADAPDLDTVLVAVGGGGLIAGVAAWYANRTKVVAVEPATSRALQAALEAGRPVDVDVSGVAVDSLGARNVGPRVFDVARRYVAEAVVVPDETILEARRRLWRDVRLVAEPGGATALAALLSGAYVPKDGERVGVLVCGSNTDPATVAT
jgi:threonine dehydratase